MSDITDRLDALERRLNGLTVGDLPLAALQRRLEQNWQPDASVLLQPGSITNDMLSEGTIADTKLLARTVRGAVSSAGAVVRGSGFTAVRSAVARYTVTYTRAFASTPIVTLGWGDAATGGGAQVTAESASAFSIVTYNTAGTLVDNSFTFAADSTEG